MDCSACAFPQFACGDSPKLVCVKRDSDLVPIPAFAVVQCTGEVINSVDLFLDAELTQQLTDYGPEHIVSCQDVVLGSSPEFPLHVVATLVPIPCPPLSSRGLSSTW